ncbi:MAG: MFS transporter [Alphaproteobacteria bacterium]|nr:MFS transporter [Alphaproteobacteria bacterium]
MTAASARVPARRRLGIAAWALYDWADSSFNTVIGTFVFSVYFARGIYGDETQGAAVWGYAMAVAGVFIAVGSPVLGAVADRAGPRKPWIATFMVICVATTSLLWFAEPDRAFVALTLVLAVIATTAHALGGVFYNAMLPDVAPPGMAGTVSGWAWGLGYAGGLGALALCLLLLVLPDAPAFGVGTENAANIRATALVTAAWFLVFALPMLLLTRDRPSAALGVRGAVRAGLAQLAGTVAKLRHQPPLLLFLIASAVYRDGLATLFAVGGLFAAGAFGMDFQEILIFAIGLNVTAAGGSWLFAALTDRVGAKRMVLLGLTGLIVFGTAILFVTDWITFLVLALILGLFVGPAQSASRVIMAKLAPPSMMTEMFGLYTMTGKAIAFVGPLGFGLLTDIFDSQRAGLTIILAMWLLGAALLFFVRVPARDAGAEAA